MTDKKTASFVQSLCMGRIEEEIIFPFPAMKAERSGRRSARCSPASTSCSAAARRSSASGT